MLRPALVIARRLNNIPLCARCLHELGLVYAALGENATAQPYFVQALGLHIRVGDRFGEISTRWWIAELQQRQGHLPEAIQELEQALVLATAVQSPDAAAIEQMLAVWRQA